MKRFFFIFLIICSCVPKTIIEKEKIFLEKNQDLTIAQAIEYFGVADDSIKIKDGKVMIWDNLNGKMTLMTAPPYFPLDSLRFLGKRQIRILFDTSNNKMKEFKYWDYTNPEDFKKFIEKAS